jgi:hypothetical protein
MQQCGKIELKMYPQLRKQQLQWNFTTDSRICMVKERLDPFKIESGNLNERKAGKSLLLSYMEHQFQQ